MSVMVDPVDRFQETKVWHGNGGSIPIRDMEDRYLRNVIDYLDDHVEAYRTAFGIALFCGPLAEGLGDMASDALDAAMTDDARQSDVAWLHSTPLYRALKREAKRRGL
jgi:hypothetical protein